MDPLYYKATSASGQNAPPVAPKIIGIKIKNARENNRERCKPKTTQINILIVLSHFYVGLVFEMMQKSSGHGVYLQFKDGGIISHNQGHVNPLVGQKSGISTESIELYRPKGVG
jgi:hypothetical protein